MGGIVGSKKHIVNERVVEARQMINVACIEQSAVNHLLEGSYEVLRNHIRHSWPKSDVNKMTLEMVLTAIAPANEIEESTDERKSS